MKKALSLLFVLCMAFCLVACGGGSSTTEDGGSTSSVTDSGSSGRLGSKGAMSA